MAIWIESEQKMMKLCARSVEMAIWVELRKNMLQFCAIWVELAQNIRPMEFCAR